MIPCSFCRPKSPKCYSFYLLWSEDGYLRVVGNKCGPKYFGQAEFNEMRVAAIAKQIFEDNENFLLDKLSNVPNWFHELDYMHPICKTIQELKRTFKKESPRLYNELNSFVIDHNGRIVIFREKSQNIFAPRGIRSSLDSEQSGETIDVGWLSGRAFLRTNIDLVTKIKAIRRGLDSLCPRRIDFSNEDAVLDFVTEMHQGTVKKTADFLRKLPIKIEELRQFVNESMNFLSQENLARIHEWGKHPDNPHKVSVTSTPKRVIFSTNTPERSSLDISTLPQTLTGQVVGE